MTATTVKAPTDVATLYSLKIDNIAYRTTQEELSRLFDCYGEVGDVHIPRDIRTRKSKGFAFVRYRREDDAVHAMAQCDGKQFDGRVIRIEMARNARPIDQRLKREQRKRPDQNRDRRPRSISFSRSRSRTPRRHRKPSTHGRRHQRRRSRSSSCSSGCSPPPSRAPHHHTLSSLVARTTTAGTQTSPMHSPSRDVSSPGSSRVDGSVDDI